MPVSRQGELLRFAVSFGRLLEAPSRYFHKDLDKLIEQYDVMMLAGSRRRSAGRPRSPGGWSDLRGVALPKSAAHMHLCDHVDSCDDPDRPQCQACEMELES